MSFVLRKNMVLTSKDGNTEISFMFALKIRGGGKNKEQNRNQSLVWKQTALVLFLCPECRIPQQMQGKGQDLRGESKGEKV